MDPPTVTPLAAELALPLLAEPDAADEPDDVEEEVDDAELPEALLVEFVVLLEDGVQVGTLTPALLHTLW